MEKVIKLVMNEDKSISVFTDNHEKHKIIKENRNIDAKTIIDLFDFKIGDTYQIQKENPHNTDDMVLDFFYNLINEIASKINNIKLEEE